VLDIKSGGLAIMKAVRAAHAQKRAPAPDEL